MNIESGVEYIGHADLPFTILIAPLVFWSSHPIVWFAILGTLVVVPAESWSRLLGQQSQGQNSIYRAPVTNAIKGIEIVGVPAD